MRTKDEAKERAVIQATIKVVNEIGFVSASISKIAKEADVSVATIYIYHKNKEDLMLNVYYEVKKELSAKYFHRMEHIDGVRARLKMLWSNVILSGSELPMLVSFAEQFSNSPYYELVDREKMVASYEILLSTITQGVKEGLLKEMTFETFVAFFIVPANFLGNRQLCANFETTQKNIDTTFNYAWETIAK